MRGHESALAKNAKLVFPNDMIGRDEAYVIGSDENVFQIVPARKDKSAPCGLQEAIGFAHPVFRKIQIIFFRDLVIAVQNERPRSVVVAAACFKVYRERRIGDDEIHRISFHCFHARHSIASMNLIGV